MTPEAAFCLAFPMETSGGRMTDACCSCGKPMVRTQNRRRQIPDGHRRHAGNGACQSCYNKPRAAAYRQQAPGTLKPGRMPNEPPDHVVVDCVCAGQWQPTNNAERDEIVKRLVADGHTDLQIATTIGCSYKAVWRRRTRLGIKRFGVLSNAAGSHAGASNAR